MIQFDSKSSTLYSPRTMSYEFYKIFHIIGLLVTVFGLFGMAVVSWNQSTLRPQLKKTFMMSHGVGLFLLIVAGFGMAAKLGLMKNLPHWIYGKLVIWVLVGGLVALIKRKPEKSALWIILTFALVISAAILAIEKPF